ncbi:hypothetical protein HII36_35520 [Nonomuraea sp. NN258]|uniref:hypothetical protein n=1 Tax=Nonomuraea antri TaxID=2730852 RepID=UPI001567D4BC|nr:hypothetical protein [Nonomuraea antri]NRQ37108.1 hypothetical protein [Nonomuraea antri]
MGGRNRSDPRWSAVPAEVLKDFDAYLAATGDRRHVELLEVLIGGFSGAQVLLVEIKVRRQPTRQRVLKFCLDAAEPERIFLTYDEAPQDFAERHLAKPVDKIKEGRCAAVVMDVAGRDPTNCRPLTDHLGRPDLREVCRTIVSSVLDGWNAGRTDLTRPYTVAEYLRSLVGEARMGPDGPLAAFATRIDAPSHRETIRLPGWTRELRNPLALADPDTPAGASPVSRGALIGDGHGDLNVFNLLIPGYPHFAAENYQIIDYGGRGTDQPLTWDPMYLLVSMATRWLGQMNPTSNTARQLVHVLARHRSAENDFGLSDHRAVVNAVYEAGYAWANRESYGDRWLPQCALSLCAAGLLFIGRKIPGVDIPLDDWFFELAAEAADDFAEQARLPIDIASARQRRGKRADGASQTGSPSKDIAEFVRLLEEAEFGGNWASVRRGTVTLRAYLEKQNYAIDSPHAISIQTLIGQLRDALKDAMDARLKTGLQRRAAQRASRIAQTLPPLLLA